jgi:RimJ/RimL family protein N-acetyltransferase
MDQIKTRELSKLTSHQTRLFQDVLSQASQDRYLSPNEHETVPQKPTVVVILLGEEPVGFYCPKSQMWGNQRYWRCGACFVVPKHQGKGIMGKVLKEYFDRYSHALSWIEDGNTKSIALFTSLGFVKSKRKDYEGYPGHWYVKEKATVSQESLPVYLRW